jgi:hypothetical protein
METTGEFSDDDNATSNMKNGGMGSSDSLENLML